MSGINGINGDYNYHPIQNTNNINLEDIEFLFSTIQKEENRTDFNSTFKETEVESDSDPQGKIFLQGLTDNKEKIMTSLDITEEQYDVLACTALGLASQETGMGYEEGYIGENTGGGKILHDLGKLIEGVIRPRGSASSGLTQIKINDFMNGDKLSEEQKSLLKDLGVSTSGSNKNNLFENPDKAAAATVVILYSIYQTYDEYINGLKKEHLDIENSITDNSSLIDDLEERSKEYLDNALDFYNELPQNEKAEFRTAFKYWILSVNGSKEKDLKRRPSAEDIKYNEESQLKKLNEIFERHHSDIKFEEDAIQYIRYALTSPGQEMNLIQYMAYGWNKGTSGTGLQLDRLLSGRIMNLFPEPEDFTTEQYSYDVSFLTEKYAEQSVEDYGLEQMHNVFFPNE